MKNKLLVLSIISLLLTGCNKYHIHKIHGEYYVNKCESFISSIDYDKNADIVFIGDSITDFYPVKEYYPEYKVANRGIAGDTTTGLYDRIDFSLYALKPKVVYMMIGINNIKTMFVDYEKILKGIKKNLPDSDIVIASLTPIGWGNQPVVGANEKIVKYCEKYSYTYVDLYSHMVDPEDYLKIDDSCFTDGIHPSEKGYDIMTGLLTPIFAELLK